MITLGVYFAVNYAKFRTLNGIPVQYYQLYVQNPAFGFYFLRLFSQRLFQNIAKLQQQVDEKTALLAARQA